jgi:hypothetical protein
LAGGAGVEFKKQACWQEWPAGYLTGIFGISDWLKGVLVMSHVAGTVFGYESLNSFQ